MSPLFSAKSIAKLGLCHTELQLLFNTVIQYWDCTIVCGFRGQKEQDEAYAKGLSQKKWPHGKHNKIPSDAADVAPYKKGIDWDDIRSFEHFGYFVLGVAAGLGINIRWGADWNKNYETLDEFFKDWSHFERATT